MGIECERGAGGQVAARKLILVMLALPALATPAPEGLNDIRSRTGRADGEASPGKQRAEELHEARSAGGDSGIREENDDRNAQRGMDARGLCCGDSGCVPAVGVGQPAAWQRAASGAARAGAQVAGKAPGTPASQAAESPATKTPGLSRAEAGSGVRAQRGAAGVSGLVSGICSERSPAGVSGWCCPRLSGRIAAGTSGCVAQST